MIFKCWVAVDAHRQELNSLRDDLQNAKDLLTLMNSQSAITKEVRVWYVSVCVYITYSISLHQEFNEMKALATTNCDKVEAEVKIETMCSILLVHL